MVGDLTLDRQTLKEGCAEEASKPLAPWPAQQSCAQPARSIGTSGLPGARAAPLDPAPHIRRPRRGGTPSGVHHRHALSVHNRGVRKQADDFLRLVAHSCSSAIQI